MHDARVAALNGRPAQRRGGQMIFACPIRAPWVPPTKVGAAKRHKDPIAFVLVVVRAEEIEMRVKGHVPRVAQAARNDFEIRPAIVTTQNAASRSPIVARILIGALVFSGAKGLRWRKVRRALRS